MHWENITLDHVELINSIKTIGIRYIKGLVQPGQSFICYSKRDNGRLNLLTVCKINNDMVWLSGGISDTWQIGEELVIRGPIGSGFELPPQIKNIVFASFGEVSGTLLPLIRHGLRHQLNMTYGLTHPWVDIPPEIELLSIQEIVDVLDWADICYFEIKREDLGKYKQVLQSFRTFHKKIQIFIHTPVLCYGQSECMICSVKTKQGYRKTCKQGNVFWLGDLEDF